MTPLLQPLRARTLWASVGPARRARGGPILDAARSLFATRGYEQTTIRAVAAQAGIDASMVMRYFGSKAGLFAAAATIDLDPPDLASASPRRRGEVLVGHFVAGGSGTRPKTCSCSSCARR